MVKKALKNDLTVAIAGISIAGIAFGLISPVVVILLEKSGAKSWVTGLSTTMGYLGFLLFSSFSGRLIDRYGIKPVMGLGLIILVLTTLGLNFWYNYYVLFPVRFLMSLGSTMLFVSTEVLISSVSSDDQRGRNMGLYSILLSVGIASGTMFIWVVKLGVWVPFLLGASLMLSVLLFEFLKLENRGIPNAIPAKFRLNKMPGISLLSAFLYGIFESSMIIALPLYGLRCGFSQDEVSLFLGSFVTGGILLLYFISRLSDLLPKRQMLLGIALVLGILMYFPAITKDFYLLMLLFFITGGIIPAFYTIGLNFAVESIETKFIPQANGHFSMFYGLGTVLGPLLSAEMIELDRQKGFWVFAASACFLFALIIYSQKGKWANGSE